MGLFQRAARSSAKLRLAISGPSGSGKTYSSLIIASGIVPLDKVAVIDTESGSANLYANLGGYGVLPLEPPYEPQKYIDAIHAAEAEGFELVIIDSLSHAWNGEGGMLDQQGKATDSKYKGNSWAAWREVTPQYNRLVETMLHSSCHIIATMRSKTEYMQDDSNGRKRIVKVGAAPIQRDGIEYEFTVVFDLSLDHVAAVSKDRTRLFDGKYFAPTADVGKALKGWLAGDMQAAPQQTPIQHAQPAQEQQQTAQAAQQAITGGVDRSNPHYLEWLLEYIWQKGGWTKEQLPGYVMKRWNKPIEQVTQEEYDALITELCQYKQWNRTDIQNQHDAEFIPF